MHMKRLIRLITIMMVMLPLSAEAQKKAGIVAHRGFWNCEEAGYAKNS